MTSAPYNIAGRATLVHRADAVLTLSRFSQLVFRITSLLVFALFIINIPFPVDVLAGEMYWFTTKYL